MRFPLLCWSPLLLAACSLGHLQPSSQFDDAKVLSPSLYAACNRGDGEACSKLAFEMTDVSRTSRSTVVVALHGLGCERKVVASCVELAILDFKRNPNAAKRLSVHCHRDESVRACEALASADDTSAALSGCKLGSEEACKELNRLGKAKPIVPEVGPFFANLCFQGRGDACLLAAEWVSDIEPTRLNAEGRPNGRLSWLAKACDAKHAHGCRTLDLGIVDQILREDLANECIDYASALARACVDFSACRASMVCKASTGHPEAREFFRRACGIDPDGDDCALFLQLPAEPKRSGIVVAE